MSLSDLLENDIAKRELGYKSIAVEKIPNVALGKTINDRLIRASKF